jgi:hypothetical protein
LKDLDKQVPSGGPRALEAFGDVMFMGRGVKIHMVAFAQLASYRSGLTPDLIENFGTKVLIGHSERAWKWLVPECGRYRAGSMNDGRGMVCRGSMAVETQLTWVDELSAAEHVLSAVPAQRRVKEMTGRARRLPAPWRQAISNR